MQSVRSAAPALTLLLAGGLAAQEQQPPVPPALTKALAKATVHNQRVLAILAAEGEDFAAALKKSKVVSRPLLYEFETVQFQGQAAAALAAQWQLDAPAAQQPRLAVLDAAGKRLASLASAEFLTEGALAGDKLLAALKPHFCQPVDAEQKLTAAIGQAKKTGRAVFVRFDAPW
jgi:hypothetical protein